MIRLNTLLLVSACAVAAQDSIQPLPSVNDVVARMMARDSWRQASLQGYTGSRRYVLENARHHKRAEMLVSVTCLDDGSKQFRTVSSTGWGLARSHVFPKLLESESEASRPEVHERSRITPENYSFAMTGTDSVNQRPAWVISVTPRTENKYLIQGKIWVDMDDCSIVRIEGKPAKGPSFWVRSVQFVHVYRKDGPFWLPASDRSVTDARILGETELTIEYFDYAPIGATLSASGEMNQGGPK
jgi:hypothetical protein